jgi:signal peptidase II
MPECVSSANQPKRIRKLDAPKRYKRLLVPAAIILVVTLLDQLSKLIAVNYLVDGDSVHVLGEFFMLTLVYNRGGAMGTNIGSSTYYLVISLILIPVLIYYINHYRTEIRLSWPLALIAGGAVGNIVDRLRLGRVIDFLDVDFFDINLFGFSITRWWTFNVADAAISCGIVILLLVTFFGHKSSAADNNDNTDLRKSGPQPISE